MFYAPDILQTLTLPEEESQHCVQVLRATVGQEILITDGVGHLYHARIVNPHRKHCEVEIIDTETPQPLHDGYVHIAIAPTKNIDRIEWMIEKATEMGVDAITPLLCRHSERKTINEERLRKIMIAAAKQSLKTTFPTLHPLTKIEDFLSQAQAEDRFIAHCMTEEEVAVYAEHLSHADQSDPSDPSVAGSIQSAYAPTDDKQALWRMIRRGCSVIILIGPEGDFSPEELKMAIDKGYKPCSLGKTRLRTETAGLFACNTAILLNS